MKMIVEAKEPSDGSAVGGVGHFANDLWLPRGLEQKGTSEAHYLVIMHVCSHGLVACEHGQQRR